MKCKTQFELKEEVNSDSYWDLNISSNLLQKFFNWTNLNQINCNEAGHRKNPMQMLINKDAESYTVIKPGIKRLLSMNINWY